MKTLKEVKIGESVTIKRLHGEGDAENIEVE